MKTQRAEKWFFVRWGSLGIVIYLSALSSVFCSPLPEQNTWPFERYMEDTSSGSGPYLDAVAGEFFDDDLQALAILEDNSVKVMAAPLIYDPPIFCDLPGVWRVIHKFPGNGSDALVVAGEGGLCLAAWDHDTAAFDLMHVAVDAAITHLCIDDMDGDGVMEIVTASSAPPAIWIKVYKETAPELWTTMHQFTLPGIIQDMETLKWQAGLERQIAIVRAQAAHGLDVLDLTGASLFHQDKIGPAVTPDRIACLESCLSDLDMLAWVTDSGAGSGEVLDQYLGVFHEGALRELEHLAGLDVTALYGIDFDGDTDHDLFLLNRTVQPVCMLNHEANNPAGDLNFGVASQDLLFLGLHSNGPYTSVHAGLAACDADYDGDLDLFFPFQDEVARKIHYFQNDLVDHEDYQLFVDESGGNEWNPCCGEDPSQLILRFNSPGALPAWANGFQVIIYSQDVFGGDLNPFPVTVAYGSIPQLLNNQPLTMGMDILAPESHTSFFYILVRLVAYDPVLQTLNLAGPVTLLWFAHEDVMDIIPPVLEGQLDPTGFIQVPIIITEPPPGVLSPPPGSGALGGGSGMGSDNDRPGTGSPKPVPSQ